MTAVRYDLAMHHAHAGKQYGCQDTTYEGITWMEENETKPTAAELEAVWTTIQADEEAQMVAANRRIAYPTIDELVVALWEKIVEVDGTTSTDIAEIQTRRTQVKTDFPNS